MPITYQQTHDRDIHERVRRKHGAIIHALKQLGFQEYYFYGETIGALGFSPLGCGGFLGMLVAQFKEVTRIERNLGITLFNLALGNGDYATYAGPFGLCVKFYTGFTDGTCVITANFETPAFQDEAEKLFKAAVPQAVEVAWAQHKDWVNKLCMEGKQKKEPPAFMGFLSLVQREDEYMIKHKNELIRGG